MLRKYVNFFQPSLKLLEKERQGAKVSKKYDSANTPFQRILLSQYISQEKKQSLTTEYEALDPVDLMAQLKALQDKLWKFSWSTCGCAKSDFLITNDDVEDRSMMQSGNFSNENRYYHTSKKVDLRKAPRTWRTRKEDPFENIWDEIRLRLELMPETTAKEIIQWIMGKYPTQFSTGQTRTLQRRIAQWCQEQESQENKLRAIMTNQISPTPTYAITDTGIQTNLNRKDENVEINY